MKNKLKNNFVFECFNYKDVEFDFEHDLFLWKAMR